MIVTNPSDFKLDNGWYIHSWRIASSYEFYIQYHPIHEKERSVQHAIKEFCRQKYLQPDEINLIERLKDNGSLKDFKLEAHVSSPYLDDGNFFSEVYILTYYDHGEDMEKLLIDICSNPDIKRLEFNP